MRINVSVELRRPARRSVAFILGALLLLTPAVVLAGHQFPDVPTGGFHDDIDWMADYGIANGFNDGTYRPSAPVTRQAMAAFMHRLSSEIVTVYSPRLRHVDGPGTVVVTANCPDDKRAIAGGGINLQPHLWVLSSSGPAGPGNDWTVTFTSVNGGSAVNEPADFYALATCAPRL